MASKDKIVVVIEGGVLQDVFWNGSGMPEVGLVDWDEQDEEGEKANEETVKELTPANGWKEIF